LVNEAVELGADAILTTEKDAVRMPRIERCAVPVYYLRIEVRFKSGLEEFERCIGEITFSANGRTAEESA
jgi:tetraacyldisaccharide 4'-kinase